MSNFKTEYLTQPPESFICPQCRQTRDYNDVSTAPCISCGRCGVCAPSREIGVSEYCQDCEEENA